MLHSPVRNHSSHLDGNGRLGRLLITLCLEETNGRSRDRAFAYRQYLDLLKVDTELASG